MTSPKYAQSVPGKGRWYVHPTTGETWPSVTNVLDVSVSKPAFVPWAAKETAAAAWALLPRMVTLSRKPGCKAAKAADRCGQCRDCLTVEMKKAHIAARDQAADLGTRVHDQAEARVLGRPGADDPEAEPFVRALVQFWVDFGVDPAADYVATECTVINRKVGYAGTADALLYLDWPDGRYLTLIDYKSSSTRPTGVVYPENGLQTAALAHAETVLLDDGTEEPFPTPERLAILNLRADDYALIPMPVAGTPADAFAAFQGALANALYLHSCYGAKPQRLAPPAPESTIQKGQAA